MSNPIRALTAPELAVLRTDQQFTEVRAVIVPQQVVLACRVAETAFDNDAVTNIAFNTVTSGSYTNVRNGMTCYVGTASGLDDLGMVRVKSCTANRLTFARVSGITWTPSVYLTVVDDFGIWAKLPTLDLTDVYMDDNIQYTNQNTYMSPTPVFGGDTAIPFTAGSCVYDGFNSYCLDGSAIVSYQWAVYNGGSLVDYSYISSGSASSGSMILTFPAPGSYTVDLTVTSENAKSTTGHRSLYVYGDGSSVYAPITQITLDSLRASREDGGWTCELTAYDSAGSGVRDRAKVIIFSSDYYGGSAVSIGQVNGSEHILMTGWISAENIRFNDQFSTVKFTVSGAQYWLRNVVGPSTFLESSVGEPSAWTSIKDMTIDDVIHHFLYWRSTAIEVMDVYRSNNTRLIGGMSASIGSIWEQIYDTAITRMLTNIAVDRYGRFHAWIDPQVIPVASRSAIPTVQAISNEDMTGDVDMNRTIVNPVSLLEVAGLAQSGSAVLMYMSRAPGSLIYNRYGQNDQNDRLVVSSQSDANMLSGMLLAKKNNTYDSININLGQVNHFLDIAPPMYVSLTVAGTSNVRQVYFTELKALIKDINYRVDKKGAVEVNLELEGETSGIPGYTVIMPQEPIYVFPDPPEPPEVPEYPIIPPYDPFPYIPPYPYEPPYPPFGAECRDGTEPVNGPYCLSYNGEVTSSQANGLKIPYNAYLRGAGASGSGIYYGGSLVSGSWVSGSAYYGGSIIDSWQTASPPRYEIRGNFTKLNGDVPANEDKHGIVFSGSAIGYSASTNDSWYDVLALDAGGNIVAVGVHDQVRYANKRSGTFYLSGSGTDISFLQIVARKPETPFIASGSSMGSYTLTVGNDAGTYSGSLVDCGTLSNRITSGSISNSVTSLTNGVIINNVRRVIPNGGWNYWGFTPGTQIAFKYRNPKASPTDTGPMALYFHVTGSTVHQYIDKTHPQCMYSSITFSGLPGATEGDWLVRATALPEDVMPIDQYLQAGWFNIGSKGFNLHHAVRCYGKNIYEWVIISNYYKIEVIPTYVMNVTDLCLYNICAPTWVP